MQRLLHEVFATENVVKQEPHLLASTSASSLMTYPNTNYLISQANWERNQLVLHKSTMDEKMLPNYWSHTNFHLKLFKTTDSLSHSVTCWVTSSMWEKCYANVQCFSVLTLKILHFRFYVWFVGCFFFPNTSFPGAKPGWRGEII